MCTADSQRLNPAQSVGRAPARQTVRDPRGQLLSAALVCWLSAYLNVAGGEAPQPKMVIPASFAQAQVSADGKHVVLVAAATSRAEDLSQPQMPGELRIVDLETGRTIATRPVPQAFLGSTPEWRRSVTPDARHYGWLDNDRWLVVSRVMDGEEVHRVDLNAMGLLATACADTMRISADGNFIIARNRRHGPEGWMRIDLDAPPRIAATLATSRREDVLYVDLAGDREHGRIAVLTKRKKDICLQLMDAKFERLAEYSLPRVEPTVLFEVRVGSYPMVALASGPTWTVFSADGDALRPWRSASSNRIQNGIFWLHSGTVSPDGQYLAVAEAHSVNGAIGHTDRLNVWSLSERRRVCDIPLRGTCMLCRFDASGRYLSMSDLQNVYVWDFADLLAGTDGTTTDRSR